MPETENGLSNTGYPTTSHPEQTRIEVIKWSEGKRSGRKTEQKQRGEIDLSHFFRKAAERLNILYRKEKVLSVC